MRSGWRRRLVGRRPAPGHPATGSRRRDRRRRAVRPAEGRDLEGAAVERSAAKAAAQRWGASGLRYDEEVLPGSRTADITPGSGAPKALAAVLTCVVPDTAQVE